MEGETNPPSLEIHCSNHVIDHIRQTIKENLSLSYHIQQAMFNSSPEIILKNRINQVIKESVSIEEQNIPGLWRINGGPEITTNQLFSILSKLV